MLETGVRSPDALALYRRAGYREIEKFGPYVESTISVCMGKDPRVDLNPRSVAVPSRPAVTYVGPFGRPVHFVEVRHAHR